MPLFTTNLIINTGTDFEQTFTLEDDKTGSRLDLTPFSVCAKLKKNYLSSSSVSFASSITNPSSGELKISLASTVTSTIPAGRYYYDIIINDGTKTDKIIEGNALVKLTVTRPDNIIPGPFP